MVVNLPITPVGGGGSRSCNNCPNMLDRSQSSITYRRDLGVEVCGARGIPLGRGENATDERQLNHVRRSIAKDCKSYGNRESAKLSPELEVAFPQLHRQREESVEDFQRAATCLQCVNYVPERRVHEKTGWTVGMCAAYGRLILPSAARTVASKCVSSVYGSVADMSGVTLLPEFSEDFELVADEVKVMLKRGSVPDPHEYVSDREVSDEDSAAGIRAWRRVEDPTGTGLETFLPIYSDDNFSPEEQALIPRNGSDEHPELYLDHFGGVYATAVAWIELDETPALHGVPGTGKTELFRHMAYLMNVPFRRISITHSTELDDLAGKMMYSEEKGTYFQLGRLPKAWESPGVLCIDEPNTGPPEVWQFLRPLTDNSKQLVLDMNEGETVDRHTDCFMGMAMNPAWDVRNIGALQIGDADANRLFHIGVPLPPPDIEKAIIRARVKLDGWEITDDALEFLMRVAADIRALSDEGGVNITWAIRQQIKTARALRWFDPATAFRRAVVDYLEPEVANSLLDIVRSHAE